MPLKPGADVGDTIREFHTGKTYKHTSKKFGKKRAQKQAIAIALKNKRHGKKQRKHHRKGKKSHRKR
jgi:hypothetical protein